MNEDDEILCEFREDVLLEALLWLLELLSLLLLLLLLELLFKLFPLLLRLDDFLLFDDELLLLLLLTGFFTTFFFSFLLTNGGFLLVDLFDYFDEVFENNIFSSFSYCCLLIKSTFSLFSSSSISQSNSFTSLIAESSF